MLKKILLTVSIIFSISICYGQNTDENHQKEINKNAIQVSAGFCGIFGAYNVTYERLIIPFKENSIIGLWAKGGFGGYGEIYSTGGPFQHLSLGVLTGENKGHFELNFGGARMYNKKALEDNRTHMHPQFEPEQKKEDYVKFNPVGSIGYRYQKPSGNFIFRCGLGYPESIYIGIGVGF